MRNGAITIRKDEARAIILGEWLALKPSERATEDQASAFAMEAADKYPFRHRGHPYQLIVAWLRPYIGLA